MAEITVGNATLTIDYYTDLASPGDSGRPSYDATIATPEWTWQESDAVRGGVTDDVDETDAMRAFLAFLSACAEAHRNDHGDQEARDMYPEHVAEWATQHSSEVDMARAELEAAH